MKQLGGIDATFLYMETPETPMHVAGLTLYEPPADFSGSFFEHFKEFFLTRMHLAPIFEKKLARTVLELDHPCWVDAGELDFDYHLRRATLPASGHLAAARGAGRRPAFGAARPHPAAMAVHRHRRARRRQCRDLFEGASRSCRRRRRHGDRGALYDMSPVPRTVKPPEPKKKARKPSIEERAILGINDAVQNVIRQQLNVMQAIPQVLGTLTDMLAPPKRRRRQARRRSGYPRNSGRAGAENAVQRDHHQPALLCGARAVADRRQAGQQGDRHQDQRRGDGDLRRRAAALPSGAQGAAEEAADRLRADLAARAGQCRCSPTRCSACSARSPRRSTTRWSG